MLLITFLEACLASIAVFIATHYVLGLDMVFSVVLAALASATAPASTMMTIRQTHARGDFVDTLLQVVALDDVVGLVAYSTAISIALVSMTGNFQAQNVLRPIMMNLFAFALMGVSSLLGCMSIVCLHPHGSGESPADTSHRAKGRRFRP